MLEHAHTPKLTIAPCRLLEGDVQLKVSAHLFVGSKASWDVIPSPGKQYETMPELSELLRPDGDA